MVEGKSDAETSTISKLRFEVIGNYFESDRIWTVNALDYHNTSTEYFGSSLVLVALLVGDAKSEGDTSSLQLPVGGLLLSTCLNAASLSECQ